jgi:CDP-diacylglycerol--serine O-phosphatidyltransferase
MRSGHNRRRGIYLLPTLFTVGTLFCGYSSLIQSSAGRLEIAAILILVAGVLDGLDGRIARLTRTTSDFGSQFDSLADMVSFGLAPSLLIYHWALRPTGRIGWLLAFLFVVCAAMRLARYNTLAAATLDRRAFVGLPSPVAGGMLACAVLALPRSGSTAWAPLVVAPLIFTVAVLMISKLRYRSFREIDLRRRSYIYVLPMAAILVAVAMYPRAVPFLLCSAYILSAPTLYGWGLAARRRTGATDPAVNGSQAGASEVADEPALR